MPIKILRLPSVITQTQLSRSSIYRLIKLGLFPKPVKLGIKASGWRVEDIEAWISSRKAEGV